MIQGHLKPVITPKIFIESFHTQRTLFHFVYFFYDNDESFLKYYYLLFISSENSAKELLIHVKRNMKNCTLKSPIHLTYGAFIALSVWIQKCDNLSDIIY